MNKEKEIQLYEKYSLFEEDEESLKEELLSRNIILSEEDFDCETAFELILKKDGYTLDDYREWGQTWVEEDSDLTYYDGEVRSKSDLDENGEW